MSTELTQCSDAGGSGLQRIVGRHPSIGRLLAEVQAVANRHCTVLISGESGTGKELVASRIHRCSARADRPFVTVDCTTLRDTLLESQLFGHVKGAFTGATCDTLGLYRAADGGVLFLDEIGELELPMQARLLRCIQESAILPLGAVHPIQVDVRVMAATNRDLAVLVRRGQFREDLYFRLNVVRLEMPPLRERRSDISELARHFLFEQARTYGEAPRTLDSQALAALQNYDWPGNVRELRNVIERAVVFSDRPVLTVTDFPPAIREVARAQSNRFRKVLPLETAIRVMIRRALRASGGNQNQAARLLKIERHRLARLMRRHGIKPASAAFARAEPPAGAAR